MNNFIIVVSFVVLVVEKIIEINPPRLLEVFLILNRNKGSTTFDVGEENSLTSFSMYK